MSAPYELGQRLAAHQYFTKHAEDDEGGLPWWAYPAIAAGAGLGTYALARHPRFADATRYPILNKIQQMAKGKMHRADVRGAPDVAPESTIQRIGRQIRHGPEAYGGELPKAMEGTPKRPAAVWSGHEEPFATRFDPSMGPHRGETQMGEFMPQFIEHLSDKAEQAKLLAKIAPEAAPKTLTMADLPVGLRVRAKHLEKDLPKLQAFLEKEFGGKEWIMKPSMGREGGALGAASSGVFPSGKTDLQAAYKQWLKMRPEYRKAVGEVEESLHDTDINRVIEAFRTRPGYEGRVIDELLHKNVIFQEKLPLEQFAPRLAKKMEARGLSPTKEYRIHTVGGKAIPSMATPRYYSGPISSIIESIKARRAAKWLQKNVLDKMKDTEKEIAYGMDVAPVKGGGYKIIEMNPGGRSGLLESHPLMPHLLHKAVTGRYSPVAAGALGLGGAGAATGLAGLTDAAVS